MKKDLLLKYAACTSSNFRDLIPNTNDLNIIQNYLREVEIFSRIDFKKLENIEEILNEYNETIDESISLNEFITLLNETKSNALYFLEH